MIWEAHLGFLFRVGLYGTIIVTSKWPFQVSLLPAPPCRQIIILSGKTNIFRKHCFYGAQSKYNWPQFANDSEF